MELITLDNGVRLFRHNGVPVTDQDVTIIKALAEGENPQTIAGMLGLSPRTVEAHKDKLRLKFNARTTPQLVSIAKDLKLI